MKKKIFSFYSLYIFFLLSRKREIPAPKTPKAPKIRRTGVKRFGAFEDFLAWALGFGETTAAPAVEETLSPKTKESPVGIILADAEADGETVGKVEGRGVGVGVFVDVGTGVGVLAGVGVELLVGVGVDVGVGVGVGVDVGVGVGVA